MRAFLVGILLLAACHKIGNQQGYEPEQPIAFSHAIHAGDNKIPCQYCHYAAEKSRHAGVPPASLCMNCHKIVKLDSPEVKKISAAIDEGKPIQWVKVHRLPDFVYFNHSRHVTTGGLKCQNCHGPVETMVRVRQVAPLTMGWCLDCHRSVNATGKPVGGTIDPRVLAIPGGLHPPTDCVGCHY